MYHSSMLVNRICRARSTSNAVDCPSTSTTSPSTQLRRLDKWRISHFYSVSSSPARPPSVPTVARPMKHPAHPRRGPDSGGIPVTGAESHLQPSPHWTTDAQLRVVKPSARLFRFPALLPFLPRMRGWWFLCVVSGEGSICRSRGEVIHCLVEGRKEGRGEIWTRRYRSSTL
jgi:hypothetical protein